MALLFICEHCGEEIIVDRFKPGDRVACKECGGHLTVPENALETEEEPNNLADPIRPDDTAGQGAGGEPAGRSVPEGERLPHGPLEQLLGETFRFYGKHLPAILAVTALPVALLYVVGRLLMPSLAPYLRPSAYRVAGAVPGVLGLILAEILVSTVMRGVLILMVCQRYTNGPVSVARAFTFTLRRLPRLIAARLMVAVLLLIVGGIGFTLFLLSGAEAGIPGLAAFVAIIFIAATLYLAVRWAFAEQAVLLENSGAAEALARSEVRVKGHWWGIFGVLFVTLLLLGMVGAVLSLLITAIYAPARLYVVQLILIPPVIIMTTLLYFDVRMRKEHYGRMHLAEALEDDAK